STSILYNNSNNDDVNDNNNNNSNDSNNSSGSSSARNGRNATTTSARSFDARVHFDEIISRQDSQSASTPGPDTAVAAGAAFPRCLEDWRVSDSNMSFSSPWGHGHAQADNNVLLAASCGG
ncbi:unnamed protein product, partial [Sphacelaria rigidula]